MRRDLATAIKARDAVAVSALRSVLAAIANAEAVAPHDSERRPPSAHPTIAGSVAGLMAGEVPRRLLTDAAVLQIVRAEVEDRLAAADVFDRAGAIARSARLRAEANVLVTYRDQ